MLEDIKEKIISESDVPPFVPDDYLNTNVT
jgi:hypothetical protein